MNEFFSVDLGKIGVYMFLKLWKENKTSVLTPMYSFFSFLVQHMKFKILKRKISQLTIKIFHDISDISASSFFVFFVNLIFFPYKMSYFFKLINEYDSCVPHMPFYKNINLIKTCVT